MIRMLVKVLPVALAVLALSIVDAASARAQNIVVVVMDDIGIDRIGDFGWGTAGPTPNIDSLAASGLRFDTFWAYPACSPFRASALTGTHPVFHGVGAAIFVNGSDPDRFEDLDASSPNMANLLGANGYRTAAVGKWHVAGADVNQPLHPLDSGFDYHAGSIGNPGGSVTGLSGLNYFNWEKCVNGAVLPLGRLQRGPRAVSRATPGSSHFRWPVHRPGAGGHVPQGGR